MNQFRIRNVVLPAVLVASGVFSTLTLPFISGQSIPAWLQTPNFAGNGSSLVFDRENRDAAIRYVGGAIVASVGAGIATIELLRRLHPSNRLSKAQKDSLNSQIRKLESEGHSDPAQLAESVDLTISNWLAEENLAEPWDINSGEANLANANLADPTDAALWDADSTDANLWDATSTTPDRADKAEYQENPEEAGWMLQPLAEFPPSWERDRPSQNWSRADFVI